VRRHPRTPRWGGAIAGWELTRLARRGSPTVARVLVGLLLFTALLVTYLAAFPHNVCATNYTMVEAELSQFGVPGRRLGRRDITGRPGGLSGRSGPAAFELEMAAQDSRAPCLGPGLEPLLAWSQLTFRFGDESELPGYYDRDTLADGRIEGLDEIYPSVLGVGLYGFLAWAFYRLAARRFEREGQG
jgi:hypothetical protein